jgi:hypothetical protein
VVVEVANPVGKLLVLAVMEEVVQVGTVQQGILAQQIRVEVEEEEAIIFY